jgi:hypothetical protein
MSEDMPAHGHPDRRLLHAGEEMPSPGKTVHPF